MQSEVVHFLGCRKGIPATPVALGNFLPYAKNVEDDCDCWGGGCILHMPRGIIFFSISSHIPWLRLALGGEGERVREQILNPF